MLQGSIHGLGWSVNRPAVPMGHHESAGGYRKVLG